MARYKDANRGQGQFIPVYLSEQIIKGTYEYTLQDLIDNKLDLSIFDRKYINDFNGAPAINPRILLKVIIFCYSIGIISSRGIAKLCEKHMIVKALAEDTEPHYTTISDFISGMEEEVKKMFTEVLFVCNEMELIGGKMYAVDGCKLPSNASKEWSGTKEELQKKYDKIKKITNEIVETHKQNDKLGVEEFEKELKRLEKMEKKANKILEFLNTHEDRKGAGGEIIQSNITDNESGKMKSAHGVIQGYCGISVADSENQVIVASCAYGSGAEGQFFKEMLDKTELNMRKITGEVAPLNGTIILADTASFSEDNLQAVKDKEMEAIIPDEQFRNRDVEMKEGERREGKECFDRRYFEYKEEGDYYECPNGKKLHFKRKTALNRNEGNKYESKTSDCKECSYKGRCIKSKKKRYRTLFIPIIKYEENLCQKMREKIDTAEYKKIYSNRMKIIEPVFANITYCKGIKRFTLRGSKKVNIQWILYGLVHNIGKCNMGEKLMEKTGKAG
jgi:transposase